jgi:hypothetical protein
MSLLLSKTLSKTLLSSRCGLKLKDFGMFGYFWLVPSFVELPWFTCRIFEKALRVKMGL